MLNEYTYNTNLHHVESKNVSILERFMYAVITNDEPDGYKKLLSPP